MLFHVISVEVFFTFRIHGINNAISLFIVTAPNPSTNLFTVYIYYAFNKSLRYLYTFINRHYSDTLSICGKLRIYSPCICSIIVNIKISGSVIAYKIKYIHILPLHLSGLDISTFICECRLFKTFRQDIFIK